MQNLRNYKQRGFVPGGRSKISFRARRRKMRRAKRRRKTTQSTRYFSFDQEQAGKATQEGPNH